MTPSQVHHANLPKGADVAAPNRALSRVWTRCHDHGDVTRRTVMRHVVKTRESHTHCSEYLAAPPFRDGAAKPRSNCSRAIRIARNPHAEPVPHTHDLRPRLVCVHACALPTVINQHQPAFGRHTRPQRLECTAPLTVYIWLLSTGLSTSANVASLTCLCEARTARTSL